MPPRPLGYDASLAQAIDAAVGSGIAAVDTSGETIHVNDAFCRMVGWSRDELLGGRPPFPYWPEDQRAAIDSAFQLTLAGRFPAEGMTLVFQRRDGRRFPALHYLAPLRDGDAVRGWVANVVDLSSQSEALARSEERLQTAQHVAGVGVWDWNLLTDEAYWSAETARMYGLPSETVVDYKAWRRQVPPEDMTRVDAIVADAVARRAPFEVEFRIRLESGETRWLLSKGKVLYDGERPVRAIGVNLDITARKQAELDLHEARAAAARFHGEQRLGALLDQSLAGVAEAGLDGRLLAANDRMCELTGYSREELLGMSLDELVVPEEVELVDAERRAQLGGAAPRTVERRYRRRDGTVLSVIVAPMLVRDAQGRADRFFAILFDATEHRAREQALADAEQRWKFALEGAGQGVWDMDLAQDRAYYSPVYATMLGYTQDEMQSSPDFSFSRVHPEDLPRLNSAIDRHGRGEIPFYREEFRVRHKDGHYLWIESRGLIVERGPEGAPVRMIGTRTDISERKRIEQTLVEQAEDLRVAKEAAEAASVAKSAFLANMSHEIRTPLNAVVGMAHLMRRAGLDAEQGARLHTLELSAEHLLEVLNAVLDLSKIDAGKMTLEESPLRLESVLANVLSMIGDRARDKGLSLSSEIDQMPRDLIGDVTRLQQALLNYANNAIKFTDHGAITIRARLAGRDDASATIRFEVEDTGIGVAPDALPRLFAAFEQADSSMTRRFGGTGLGLAITRKLAEAMSGAAGAHSTPGVGSTFWFTARLRIAREAGGGARDRDRRGADSLLRQEFAGARVLLVEDNEINQEVAKAILEDAGLVVDVAADGLEAVSLASGDAYRLVLMDMQMPRMDGLDATRAIRRVHPAGTLPVIAMTANVFVEDRARCLAAGMDDFISKPVDPDTLYALLLAWLRKSSGAGG